MADIIPIKNFLSQHKGNTGLRVFLSNEGLNSFPIVTGTDIQNIKWTSGLNVTNSRQNASDKNLLQANYRGNRYIVEYIAVGQLRFFTISDNELQEARENEMKALEEDYYREQERQTAQDARRAKAKQAADCESGIVDAHNEKVCHILGTWLSKDKSLATLHLVSNDDNSPPLQLNLNKQINFSTFTDLTNTKVIVDQNLVVTRGQVPDAKRTDYEIGGKSYKVAKIILTRNNCPEYLIYDVNKYPTVVHKRVDRTTVSPTRVGGGSQFKTYHGKRYVVRTGPRGGSYIVVAGKKVYIK